MYNHAPPDYVCPLCKLARDDPNRDWNLPEDVVLRDDLVVAFVSSVWWPHNPGHVVVVPREHYENIYDLPDEVGARIYATARKLALAFKTVYECDGVSTRQHNEPAGNQDTWHFHLHVFPRYTGDNLYVNYPNGRRTTAEERRPYADKLRAYFAAASSQPQPP